VGFFDALRKIIVGTLWGDVVPSRPDPPKQHLDARLWAISALLDYVATISFEIDNSPSPNPKAFQIPRENLLDEWPDSMDTMVFPSIAVTPGEPVITPRGFSNSIDESTLDLFGVGTALLPMHEHQERIVLEIWATTRFQRAAIVAGLQTAFDEAEEMSGIRLPLPDYFGQTARFTLEGDARVDDENSARRRRRARMTVRMEVDVVRLVNTVPILPEVETVVVGPLDTLDGSPPTS
jgi:hypothetical protein